MSRGLSGAMKALVLVEPGRMELRDVPIPAPGQGELLIQVEAATTCGTDLKAFLRGHPQIPMPGPFGHEYSGVVIQAGPGAKFKEGDAVMGVHSAPCQQCRWCRRGQENLCETIMATKVLGSYAEGLVIPERIARLNVFPKPASVPFEVASLLEPLSCVAHGVARSRATPDDRVLIIGPGAIGLMFVAALKHLGVEQVTLAGRSQARLEIGRSLGAGVVQWEEATGRYDLVIECTGKVEVWERSMDFADRGALLMLFGGCPAGTIASFSTMRLHYDDIRIVSPFHFGTADVRQAYELIKDKPTLLAPLISGHRKLEEAPETFEDLQAGKGLKYVFHPGS